MRFFSKFTVILFATLAISGGLSASATADPIFLTQGAYLSQNDSPFNDSNFSYFHLENFEDGLLNPSGALLTHAGVVWTDIGWNAPTPYFGAVTFEAFGANGAWLGAMNPYLLGDGMDTGQKGDDRFFGVIYDGGIPAIRIGTDNKDWEVDHLQYGATSPAPVPEPSTLLLVGAGAAGLLRKRFAARATQKRSSEITSEAS